MDIDPVSRLSRAHAGLAWLLMGSACLVTAASPLLAARAMRPLEIKQRYAKVLGILATGELDQAVADLVELEVEAVGDRDVWKQVEPLWRAKLQVIRDLLVGQNVDLLMPVIMLHHDSYFRYSEMDRRHLAQHARTMTTELADVYAERAGTPAAESFAGWILTSFAAYLWSPSNIGTSAELFHRAKEVDPGNDLALQGLAAAWERSGSYEKAIESLRKALRRRPGDAELLLRLALCNLRDPEGSHQGALEQLSALTRSEAPEWVRSVAYQELARTQLSGEEPGQAEATLREGLLALPGDQQLSLQLASILDGQRRRSEAMVVLDAIVVGGWDLESARQTYDFWEPPDLSEMRSKLRQQMAVGLEPLAAGLASLTAQGGG